MIRELPNKANNKMMTKEDRCCRRDEERPTHARGAGIRRHRPVRPGSYLTEDPPTWLQQRLFVKQGIITDICFRFLVFLVNSFTR